VKQLVLTKRNILWEFLVIHHSLTKDYRTVSWQAIRRYHKNVLEWDDIGYHYGIEKVNDHIEALIGRPTYQDGAHTRGYNHNTIGICIVGNWDKDQPTNRILTYAIKRVVVPILLTKPDPLEHVAKVVGHNYFNPAKSCPGQLFDMNDFRERIRKVLTDENS